MINKNKFIKKNKNQINKNKTFLWKRLSSFKLEIVLNIEI
jgi:hypothetical protein